MQKSTAICCLEDSTFFRSTWVTDLFAKGGLIIINTDSHEVWFLTGSQQLYGKEVLRKVEENSKRLVNALDEKIAVPAKIVWKPVLKDAIQIKEIIDEANSNNNCIGLIAWMHTFSPAKMWIAGLKSFDKPFLHLHTQFEQKIP